LIRGANIAQTAIDARILAAAGKGEPEKLPEMERPVGKRAYGEFIQTASDEMTTRRPSNSVAPEFSNAISLEVIDSDLKGVLRLPKWEMHKITIPQLQSELDEIGKNLSKLDGNTYQFERAENSIGLEIWPDSPLLAQLEPDLLARLRFRRSFDDIAGSKPANPFFAARQKWRVT